VAKLQKKYKKVGFLEMEKTTNKSKKSAGQLKVTYVKSVIGREKRQVKVLEGLGLRKLNTTKVFPDNESIRGSLFLVKHLVKVEEVK
jgi:large subunit ribosomal protein L30